ncbi:MAG: fibronectin type III domain-containing protein, partial [Ferruginibacter sp.]
MKMFLKNFIAVASLLSIIQYTAAQSSLNYTTNVSTSGSLILDMNANTINTSGATNLLNNGASNSTSAMQSIGFDFFFMGKYYSHFTAGSNGTIALGINTSAANIITPTLSNDLTRNVAYPPGVNTAPVLAPFWDRMVTAYTGATIRKIITGIAPNRCCVIEWNTAINNGSYTGAPSALFQARLYETTGIIEYVYGPMAIVTNPSPTIVTASIGFTAGNANNQFIAVQNLNTYPFTTSASAEPATQALVNSSAVGAIAGLNSTVEDSRRQFRFTPTPLIGTNLNALNITAVGATIATLNWVDTYTNESNYTVLVSTDNINFTNKATLPANSTQYQVTGLTNNTLYYFKVLAHNEGATSNAAADTATTFCSMNGTYSIGTGGDFNAIYIAAENLKLRGISGNVFFELSTTYNPANELYAVKFPKLNQIPCATNSFGLTVRPAANASNITISNFTDSAIFYLDSCTYITLDGRPGGIGNTNQLTLTNTRNAP